MQIELDGRVALVTGGSRGIGLAVAKGFVDAGARVCITARNQTGLDDAVRHLDAGERVLAVAGRADDPEHQHDAVSRTIAELGGLDILVNNAATNRQFGPLIEADRDAITKTMAVNALAPLFWTQQAWSQAMREHGGSVLNIASVSGLWVGKYFGSYNMSKAALIRLTEQLALELGPQVRANALAVGMVRTSMSQVLYEGDVDDVLREQPLARFGTPEDIADAAVFLCSDRAGWITGETLVIDGGGTSLSGVNEAVVRQLPRPWEKS